MGIRNSCKVELCDYFTPCGMDRGHPVVFGWQMGWFKESKMAPLTCLAFWGWLEGWAQQAPSTGTSRHTASPAWWPQNSPTTYKTALRIPRASVPASKVKEAWPCITWPLKSHDIAFAVLCGWSSRKPTQVREEGHRRPTSQWEKCQSIYSQVLQSSQMIYFLNKEDWNMFKCY